MRQSKKKSIHRKSANRDNYKKIKLRPSKPAITTAIVPVSAPLARQREFSREHIDLIKRTVAKGASDDELALFLHVCKRHGFDPLLKQIYALFFPVEKHHQDENGIWVSGKEMVIVTGINGYRMAAARDHTDYAGSTAGKFTFGNQRTPDGKRLIPETCTLDILSKSEPRIMTVTVRWDEFAPKDLTTKRADFWNRMPTNQLEKCCEAKGLRKRFPGLADMVIDAEMDQRLQQFTPGGRQIVNSQGFNSTGTAITYAAQNRTFSGEPLPEHSSVKRCEAADEKLAQMTDPAEIQKTFGLDQKNAEQIAEKNKKKQPPVTPEVLTSEKHIEWDWSGPLLRGDLSEVLPALQKYCPTMIWKDQWWHIAAKDFETVKQFCEYVKYRFIETGQKTITAPISEKGPSSPEKKKMPAPALPTLIQGTIQRISSGMTSRNNPTRQVKLDSTWHTCYVNTIFEFLDKGLGRAADLWIDARHNIVGIKKIGSQEFDEDGRTPIVARDREPGKTLF